MVNFNHVGRSVRKVRPELMRSRRPERKSSPVRPPRAPRSLFATPTLARRIHFEASSRIYLALGVTLVLTVASILLSARTTESSYQITQVQAENNQLQAEAQQLHYQAAALHTPEQVAAEARAEGMNYPAAAGYLQLPSEGFDLQAPIGTATDQNSPWRLFSMAANSIYGLSFPQSGVA